MDEFLVALNEYGADVGGAMGRFLDDVPLYKVCFSAFLEDEAFPRFEEALEAADYKKAFEYAHTLKGITGNMGLSPLYRVICNLVEALRDGESPPPEGCQAEIADQLNRLRSIRQAFLPPEAPSHRERV